MTVLAGYRSAGGPDLDAARRAAQAWARGGLVAVPTETVYGLAADAQDAVAVARIYRVKGRPADHPLIVHVADAAALGAWTAAPNPHAAALAAAFWPGPLTVVVERCDRAGDHITGGQRTVAVRCPGHPVALACLRALADVTGDPARGVAAPSANRFGRVSPTRVEDVVAELGGRLDPARDLVIDGGSSEVGLESTIVDCTGAWPRILRPGAIGQDQVDAVLAAHGFSGSGRVPPAATDPRAGGVTPDPVPESGPASERGRGKVRMGRKAELRAPGMLESHYAPAAAVVVLEAGDAWRPQDVASVDGRTDAGPVGLIALTDVPTPAGWTRLAAPADAGRYAHELYSALRRADALGLASVVAVLPGPERGPLATAVADRLHRAAHPRATEVR